MTDQELRELFEKHKTIVSVGLSSKPERPSFGVASYLVTKGFRVIPVNPHEKEILGEKAYPDLRSVPGKIGLIQVFRKPDAVPAIVKDAIDLGAEAIWMQDGAGNESAAMLAEAAGIKTVVNDCMARQHQRLYVA